MFTRVLVIADIEGSSGCYDYDGSRLLTPQWKSSVYEMSLDIDSVVHALFDEGAHKVIVKDFHRTGYNLIPGLIDRRAIIRRGYVRGPIPGIGSPEDAEAVLFVGMHSASGRDGFLPHTLTSRISKLEVNSKPITESELIAGLLAPYGLRPIFFSGCPDACRDISEVLESIVTVPVDKKQHITDKIAIRKALAIGAVRSLHNTAAPLHRPVGPFEARITMRDGEKAAQDLASKWQIPHEGADLFLKATDVEGLFISLVRLCYLTPRIEQFIMPSLMLYNAFGWTSLHIARHFIVNAP